MFISTPKHLVYFYSITDKCYKAKFKMYNAIIYFYFSNYLMVIEFIQRSTISFIQGVQKDRYPVIQ